MDLRVLPSCLPSRARQSKSAATACTSGRGFKKQAWGFGESYRLLDAEWREQQLRHAHAAEMAKRRKEQLQRLEAMDDRYSRGVDFELRKLLVDFEPFTDIVTELPDAYEALLRITETSDRLDAVQHQVASHDVASLAAFHRQRRQVPAQGRHAQYKAVISAGHRRVGQREGDAHQARGAQDRGVARGARGNDEQTQCQTRIEEAQVVGNGADAVSESA